MDNVNSMLKVTNSQSLIWNSMLLTVDDMYQNQYDSYNNILC